MFPSSCFVIFTILSLHRNVFGFKDNNGIIILRREPTGVVITQSLSHSNRFNIHDVNTGELPFIETDEKENASSKLVESIRQKPRNNDSSSQDSYVIINSPEANIIINMARYAPYAHPRNSVQYTDYTSVRSTSVPHYYSPVATTTTDDYVTIGSYSDNLKQSYINHYLNNMKSNLSTLANVSVSSGNQQPKFSIAFDHQETTAINRNLHMNKDEELFEIRNKGHDLYYKLAQLKYLNKKTPVQADSLNNGINRVNYNAIKMTMKKNGTHVVPNKKYFGQSLFENYQFATNNRPNGTSNPIPLFPKRPKGIRNGSSRNKLNHTTKNPLQEAQFKGRTDDTNTTTVFMYHLNSSLLLDEIPLFSDNTKSGQPSSSSLPTIHQLSDNHKHFSPIYQEQQSQMRTEPYPSSKYTTNFNADFSQKESLKNKSYDYAKPIKSNSYINQQREGVNYGGTNVQTVRNLSNKPSNDVSNYLGHFDASSFKELLQTPVYKTNEESLKLRGSESLNKHGVGDLVERSVLEPNYTRLATNPNILNTFANFQIGSKLPLGANPRNVYPQTRIRTTLSNLTRISQKTFTEYFPSTQTNEVSTTTHDLEPVTANYVLPTKKYLTNDYSNNLLKSFLSPPVLLLLGAVFAISAVYTATQVDEQPTIRDLQRRHYITALLDQPYFQEERKLRRSP